MQTESIAMAHENVLPELTGSEPEQLAKAIKAMASPLRLKILCVLSDQEMTVGMIVDGTGGSQSNISQHLDRLHSKGILVSRKEANRIYYRIRDAQVLDLIALMRSLFCHAG